jgi:type 1 glutamine amidotransferase
MLRLIPLFALTGLFALAACASVSAEDAVAKIQVLLIAGDDVAPFHDWRDISESTREVLVESGRFDVRICEDPLILESNNALAAYDVIVFTMFNKSVPMITDQAKENLIAFVKGGKGFYSQHLASASFGEWEEFGKLCGRHWVMGTSGHGPRSNFPVKITKQDHPITRGLEGFKIFDELYATLQGSGPIEVLVEAESDWSNQTEPMVFTSKYGEGRSVHNALGHDYKSIKNPNMKTLIIRSVEWVATGKVAAGQ